MKDRNIFISYQGKNRELADLVYLFFLDTTEHQVCYLCLWKHSNKPIPKYTLGYKTINEAFNSESLSERTTEWITDTEGLKYIL